MAAYDILLAIVRNGSNLVLNKPVSYDIIQQLAAEAGKSGAHLTIGTNLSYELIFHFHTRTAIELRSLMVNSTFRIHGQRPSVRSSVTQRANYGLDEIWKPT